MPHQDLIVGPNEPDNKAFGDLLKQFRILLGLTREEAAQKCGFTSEYIRRIERGERTPAWGNMPTIFDVYDVRYRIVGEKYIIDEASIKFTSRIRQKRVTNGSRPHITKRDNRSQQIGKIVELLIHADDELLEKIHWDLITTLIIKDRVENIDYSETLQSKETS